jgi:hypothetical protein
MISRSKNRDHSGYLRLVSSEVTQVRIVLTTLCEDFGLASRTVLRRKCTRKSFEFGANYFKNKDPLPYSNTIAP